MASALTLSEMLIRSLEMHRSIEDLVKSTNIASRARSTSIYDIGIPRFIRQHTLRRIFSDVGDARSQYGTLWDVCAHCVGQIAIVATW